MIVKIRHIFIFITILFLRNVNGQLAQWEYAGYGKNLLTYSDGTLSGLPFEMGGWQNTFQLRFNVFWYPAENINASIQTRNLFLYQKNIRLSQQFLEYFTTESYYFDMKMEWKDEDNLYASSEIDRLYLNWTQNNLQAILGRQRIAWGTCLVWNPSDLFNPFDILDFDYEERPGTDALHLQYYTGPLSQFNIAVTPGKTRYDVIYAGRYATNKWNYDFNFIIGWQRNSMRLVSSWAGQFFDGGFRGEVLFTNPDIVYTILNLNPTSLADIFVSREIKDPYWTFSLSYDYTFESSLYIHTEYLYNGLGATKDAGLRRFDIIYTGELIPARHSIFQEFAYQLTPLIRADFFIIFNPNDKSWIAAPSIQYSLATNWELYLLAFPSQGDKYTEYGDFPNQYFIRIRYSF